MCAWRGRLEWRKKCASSVMKKYLCYNSILTILFWKLSSMFAADTKTVSTKTVGNILWSLWLEVSGLGIYCRRKHLVYSTVNECENRVAMKGIVVERSCIYLLYSAAAVSRYTSPRLYAFFILCLYLSVKISAVVHDSVWHKGKNVSTSYMWDTGRLVSSWQRKLASLSVYITPCVR